ncbi:oligosaccharide flippase family protein [Tenacibaculum pacificus]|uniref:oligosaccharide flippase family protein n=1 Tax=Tenacibaculum pacificus TaxID=3018314 RepID=UPI0022F3D435|nr:oligosaccharide flippase family protein [Tenacibaculum pacificus]WBX74134.1 oligosaccharide flippase family protein [Tenacibaculum pacificus]
MRDKFNQIKILLNNNKKIIENYSFMTILKLLNVFFGLLVYPYALSKLGSETYGIYILALSTIIFLTTLVRFSLDLLGTKEIVENITDLHKKSEIVSSVVFSRLLLSLVALLILFLLQFFFVFIEEYFYIYLLCFLTCFSQVFFHPWYFQAIQKMRIVTYIQVAFKILSLPFIFLFVKTPSDLSLFVAITMISAFFGAVIAFIYLLKVERIKIFWVGFKTVKNYLTLSLPLFFTQIMVTIKSQSIIQFIGVYFGMHEVALYDLAQKIFNIPTMLVLSINAAIFPKFANNPSQKNINKVIKYEYIISFFCMLSIIVLGKWAVLILGGEKMQEAYYILVILSFNVLFYLVIGAYHYFIFILNDRADLVSKNQLIALISLIVFSTIGLSFYFSIYVFAVALVLSGMAELVYCILKSKKITELNNLKQIL